MIDARRVPGLVYQRAHVLPAKLLPEADQRVAIGPAPAADHLDRAARVVARHHREVGFRQHLTDLLGHRGEHRAGVRADGHQHRHPPQRGLLLDDRAQLHAGLRVRDRGPDELGEGGHPVLVPWTKPLGPCGRGDHRPPQPAVDDDRAPRAGPHADAPQVVRHRSGRPGEPRDPGRLAAALDRGGDALTRNRQPGPDQGGHPRVVPAAEHGRGTLGLVPEHQRDAGARELREFLGHRGEDLIRGGGLGHEHGDPAQRRLLAGESFDLRLRGTQVRPR